MSYSILRVARVKGSSNTKGIQRHNQRENKNYNNKDIDHTQTYRNYDLINNKNIDYKKIIDEKIDANYTGNRKIRSDAIRHVDGLITSDEKFFKNLDEDETDKFFKDSLEFLEKEYGRENIVYATVHLDEKVPHMHFGFAPLTEDGRLSAKDKIGNKKQMTELQDRFNTHVNEKGYEMERGVSKQLTERQHQQMDQYKIDTKYHQSEYEITKDEYEKLEYKTEQLRDELEKDLNKLRESADFNFEDEKQIEKNLFGKVTNEQITGRKIISTDDYDQLEQRLFSATRILNDYEELKKQDLYKENEKLKKENEFEKNKASEWMDRWFHQEKKVDELEKDNDQLKEDLNLAEEFQNSAAYLYSHTRRIFPGFEKGYNKVKEQMLNNATTERVGRFMEITQEHVYSLDKKQQRRRTNDLEM